MNCITTGLVDAASTGTGPGMGESGTKPLTISVTNLRKRYPDFLLHDVSFSLPQGYVMGLVGPNGAGKTTIIKLIMNLIRPDGGQIELFGLDHRAHEEEVKRRIGFVYDVPPFYGDISLRDTKRAVALFYATWNETLFNDLISQFQLPINKKVKTLSKGMRTKFALALALSHDADLLVLDEPTSGLDPVFRRELLHGLSGILQDQAKSILFSTHITTDLERIADFVTFIRGGEVTLSASREELLDTWGVVRGDEAALAAIDPATRHGFRRHAHGAEVLTSDAAAAQAACGDSVVIDPASLEDIVVLLETRKKEQHA
jgi:ABC-2 type transport system ATP-binding protein